MSKTIKTLASSHAPTLSKDAHAPSCQGHWAPAINLAARPAAIESRFDIHAFAPEGLVEAKTLDDVEWLEQHRERFSTVWLNVEGLGNVDALKRLGKVFGLHPLSLEDVLTLSQRPKFESYSDYHFIVLRMLQRRGDELVSEQLSVFLGKDFVLTFQEGVPGDCLGPLRTRLKAESKAKHDNLASYLAYAIIDAVVDSYFPLLEAMGEHLDELEDRILFDPSPQCVRAIHDVKRDLLTVRRAVWPLREAMNPLFHDDTGLVCPETKLFLRDCNDHCIQVIEIVETYREVGSSLMDVYLSSLSNKMNEVMKFLTIITTIFVPLTFLAGVYGMNFNPLSSPFNMPELNAYWGYPVCLAAMAALALGELWVFRRWGWIFSKPVKGISSLDGSERP